MNAFPDFSQHGYQISRELGYNSLGGRVTYLATKINTTNSVVIKQFQFAQLGASWAEYEAYEQEIKVLKKLDNPGIPRYLDSFQTNSGFCMVQEYKNAESAVARTLSPPDIKQIAIATLKILVYLQSQKRPIIHRDIKPENLLIDEDLNIYLVDFGFARLGGGNIAASSIVKGTMGFMPPEQMFNRKLTKASDIYGLGATLICLLTGTKSADIGNLIDDNYGLHFRHLLPPLPQGWINWLDRMVAPRLQDRFKSAAVALAALKSLDVSSLPKVRIEHSSLEFTATEYGEIMTQTLAISNPIPKTMLCGRWEVAPHRNDPPHTPYDHSWIFFQPHKFESNQVECEITVDTRQLLANKIYHRQIILHANSDPDTYKINIQVKTAPLPRENTSFSVGILCFICLFILVGFSLVDIRNMPNTFSSDNPFGLYLIFATIATSILPGIIAAEIIVMSELDGFSGKKFNWNAAVYASGFSCLISVIIALTMSPWGISGVVACVVSVIAPVLGSLAGIIFGNSLTFRASIASTAAILGFLLFTSMLASNLGLLVVASVVLIFMVYIYIFLNATVCFFVFNFTIQLLIYAQRERGVSQIDAAKIAFLTAGFWTSFGVAFQVFLKFKNQIDFVDTREFIGVASLSLASLAVTAIPLLDLIVFKPKIIIDHYRKSERNLIKP
jgi:serine/threonine protein kinase